MWPAYFILSFLMLKGYFRSFVSLIHSSQKINKWTWNKKNYSLGYNLLFDIVTIPCEAFFILVDDFVDACGISCRFLFFNSLPLCSSLLIVVCSTLNLCTHQFIVDFVITFCPPYTTYILMWISLLKTFSSIKNWITFCARLSVSLPSLFFFLPHNFQPIAGKFRTCGQITFSNMYSVTT